MAKEGGGSVLIAAPTEAIAQTIHSVLPDGFYPVRHVSSMTLAKQRILREKTDILIVYSPLPDESGVQAAIETARQRNVGVLLFVRQEVYDQVSYTAADSGVFVLARPAGRQSIAQAVKVLYTMKNRLERLTEDNAALRRKLDDMRVVNRAKCLLIEKKQMTEEEAHHYLEKLAMDACITKREAATDIIRRLEL